MHDILSLDSQCPKKSEVLLGFGITIKHGYFAEFISGDFFK